MLGSGDAYPEEGHDPVPGDGLQEAGGSSEALQPSPTRGEEGADDNDPWGWPCQGANHQVPVDGFTKPVGHQHHLRLRSMAEPRERQRRSSTTQAPGQVGHQGTPPWGGRDRTGEGPCRGCWWPPPSMGGEQGSGVSGSWGSVPIPLPVTVAGDEGEVWDGGSPSPVPGGGRLRLRAVGSHFCWCWRPRSVTCRVQRAGLPQLRRQRRQPCLLTNKRAACSPGAGGRAADVQQNMARAHTSPQRLLQARPPPRASPHPGALPPGPPRTLQCHPVCPVCPGCSPPRHTLTSPWGCPFPSPFLGAAPGGLLGSPHACPAQPRDTHLSRRTTPSMHAPKRTTELISAGWSRRARGMWSPARPPTPCQRGTGTPIPARRGTPVGQPHTASPAALSPVAQAQASPEGYRPQRWWRWLGWCPWGWTSGRPVGLRSGWSQP